ncbi:uncharacterized protein K452DRAFT_314999 [Aplosporella prunicola CBS 121167]|uniref:protein disulfide-isomerase n=1 Tax=Aplosporella prunicola CBS 121167 TaxID=1176127 RepID=A0A6A6BU31_9PEZI|nr:uncharacterized protein K452DRAFT_314999 [Aplosporella prunicola CBS 121167]KAF2146775.1 hypothetical protein K452DRAFT_314999 [Aplosporella prunicola CBS 121167]
MVCLKPLVAAAATLLLSAPVVAESMYSKSSPVVQVDAKNYDRLIAKSNHTSIVEFYAPWCGHCRNLKPAYEKAAKNLAGLAKVAAVNCDEDVNKNFCATMGVKGFPTLKVVRPGKKPGRPVVEDYQGARSAKAIVDYVADKIPNHVKRVGDKDIEGWLEENTEAPKAMLFTEKGTTSALLRSLAIDFLGSIEVAQVRNKEKATLEKFGVTKFPTLILLPGGDKEAIVYDGELKKEPMVAFFSQVASPNPDPAPSKGKADKTNGKDSKANDSKKSAFSAASKSHESADSSAAKATASTETLENNNPTESPDPNVVTDDTPLPVEIKDLPPTVPVLVTSSELETACLTSKARQCVLAFLPPQVNAEEPLPEDAQTALTSLGEVLKKHKKGGHQLFPIYRVPADNDSAEKLRKDLGLKKDGVGMLLLNAKKGWYKKYDGAEYSRNAVESWIDSLKMGEGKKEKLPKGLVVEAKEPAEDKEAKQQPVKIDVEDIMEEQEKQSPEHGEL